MSKKIFLNWDEITRKVKNITVNRHLISQSCVWGDKYKEVFEIDYINWAKYIEWDWDILKIIEENQEKKPKFKIWDLVVGKKRGGMRDNYTMIHSIFNIDWQFAYNFEKYREYDIRTPTEEELKTYFK